MDSGICALWIALGSLRLSDSYVAMDSILDETYRILFAITLIALTWRFVIVFNTNLYLGKLLKIVKVMTWETVKFMAFIIVVLLALVFAARFLAANDKRSSDLDDFWYGIFFTVAVFFGGDDGAWSQSGDTVSMIFMTLVGLFGTMLITNLLIAILTNEYERVSEQAAAEILFNKTELVYDLRYRVRLLPPPLTAVVILIACVMWILNFIASVLQPSWNLYGTVDHSLFEWLKKMDVRRYLCMKWFTKGSKTDHEGNPWSRKKIHYFRSMNRMEVFRWHLGSIRALFSCFKCCTKWRENSKSYQLVHHRNCYGELVVCGSEELKEVKEVDGVRMAAYMKQYTKKTASGIDPKDSDRLMLISDAADVIFCRFCSRSFSLQKYQDELTTPFNGLLVLISLFVFLVLVYIPLFPILYLLSNMVEWYYQYNRKKLNSTALR